MGDLVSAQVRAERFLRDFHARRPAVTRIAYARGFAVGDGRSSYELCAAAIPAGARVLDLGCGDGWMLRGRNGWIGIDLSADEVRLAHAAGAIAVQARAEALPFRDRAFDACASHLAFSILPAPAIAARELARVLVPGGVLAIVTGGAPAEDDAFEWLLACARPLVAALADRRAPRLGDRRARSAEGLDELLGPAGFAPVGFARHTIDLGGGFDEVWTSLATLYELDALDDGARAALREAFAREVSARIAPGARVPCTMRIAVATTTREAAR